MILLGVVGTLAAVIVAQLLIDHYFDRKDFSDRPCVPDGACAAGRACAMHSSTLDWIRKGHR